MNIKSKALLAYVVIFLLGGASGFFLNEAIKPQFPRGDFERRAGMERDFSFERDGELQQRMRNFLINKLDLQDNQIEPFFEVQSQHFQTLFDTIKVQKENEIETIRQLYTNFVENVDEILSNEQIEELNSIAHPDSVRERRMQQRHRRGFR